MKIAGQQCVDTPCEAIWPLIFDPGALLQLVPGCDQVEQTESDHYRACLTLRVPALAGSYEILIRVVEKQAPSFCRLEGHARGPAGGVQGQGVFKLAPQGQQTLIEYNGEAYLSGPLGGMHPRFAEGVAQTLIRQGLNKLAELARQRQGAEHG
jgi:carbon monoxide dehydrogenase subunit G